MAARDPIGVKPLYYGEDRAGNQVFASEIKAIAAFCPTFKEFPAGHYFTPQQGLQRYFDAQDFNPSSSTGPDVDHQLRQLLTHAVDKQLMADVPVGCLLSGGLDSSLIAAIIRQLRPQETLYTFSVGIHADAPDLKAARQVAAHIGSEHHEVIFDLNQVKKDLKQILWRLESYDLANVRSGIPLYYLCQAIAEKAVGEGVHADRIRQGAGGLGDHVVADDGVQRRPAQMIDVLERKIDDAAGLAIVAIEKAPGFAIAPRLGRQRV